MRTLLLLLTTTLIAFPCTCEAGRASAEDLANALQAAVERAAAGDVNEAMRAIHAETLVPKDPREVMTSAEELREAYRTIEGYGERDGVERISLRFTGESFFRLRVVEKRANGVVVWTFLAYRFKGEWYCKAMKYVGSDDFGKIMRESLDPADVNHERS